MINQIIHGDCLEVLKSIPDNYFDSLITDPPAGISFMSKNWDDHKGGMLNWINWFSEVMNECLRTMKPGACGLVWSIPRTSHWTGMALELAGFRLIDVIHHCQGEGFPKGQDISKHIDAIYKAEREIMGKAKGTGRQNPNWNGTSAGRKKNYLSPEYNVTASATPEAKQWDGWKTPALKPSVEGWWLIEKPDFQKPFKSDSQNVIIEWSTLIKYFVALCLSVNNAKTVFNQAQKGFWELNTKDQKLDSVLRNVAKTLMETSENPLEKTVMFRSQEMEKIALSIVSLWNSILEESWTRESISTTSMGSNLITELKISYLLTLESISQNTTHRVKTPQKGNSFLAQNVETFLRGSCVLHKKVITSSVVENVLTDIGIILLSSLARIAENNLVEKDMIVSSVQSVVALNLTRKQDLDKKENQSPVSNAEKSLNVGNQVTQNTVVESAWQTLLQVVKNKRLSPAVEGWWLVQKPISESSIARNILKHGVGGINVEACRIEPQDKESFSKHWDRDSISNMSGGNYRFSKSGEMKQRWDAPTGRYPANLILSCGADCDCDNHSPDCPVSVIGEQSGICTSGEIKPYIRRKCSNVSIDKGLEGKLKNYTSGTNTGTAARYFKQLPFDPETVHSVYYQAKASTKDRSCNGAVENVHPTVKSRYLMQYLIKLITPPDGIVLDPFGGSGTTAIAAKESGFNYVLIEKEQEYVDIINQRLGANVVIPELVIDKQARSPQTRNNKVTRIEKHKQLSLFS
jgi:DNA modification methylase